MTSNALPPFSKCLPLPWVSFLCKRALKNLCFRLQVLDVKIKRNNASLVFHCL